MAQATVLAAGNGAASSSSIVVAAGAKVTVGLFVASGDIPPNAQFSMVHKTPGADLTLNPTQTTVLSAKVPRVVLDAPGTYVVNRLSGGSSTVVGQVGAGKTYYAVTALNAQGESLPSEVSVSSAETNNTVTLSWGAVTGATGYKVYRGNAAGGENVMYSPGNVLTFTDVGTGGTAATKPPKTNTSALAAPVAATIATAATGGTLAAGAKFYVVTATNALGETIKSNEKTITTTGTTSTVTLTWGAVAGATGYKIYRGTATGVENVYYSVGAVTTFTDTGAASTAGTPPGANTTGLTSPVQSAPTVASPGITTAASVGVFTDS
jgi:hypothetical protein